MSKHGPVSTPSWPLWAKVLVSLAICWHFFTISLAVTDGGNAPRLATLVYYRVVTPAHPYVRALFLTNAYRFFAPNPGATGMAWFHLKYADGTTRWFELPRADEFFLRMPYQRRLALAMSIQQNMEFDARGNLLLSPWGRVYVSSYARHICRKLAKTTKHADGTESPVPVEHVQVFRVDHGILELDMIEAGWHHTDLRNHMFYYLGAFKPNGEQIENAVLGDSVIGYSQFQFAAAALVSDAYPVMEKNGDLSELALPPPIRKLLADFPELRDPEIRRKILLAGFADPSEYDSEEVRKELVALRDLRPELEQAPPAQLHALLEKHYRLRDVLILMLEVHIGSIIGRNDKLPESPPPPLPPALLQPTIQKKPVPGKPWEKSEPAKAPVRG